MANENLADAFFSNKASSEKIYETIPGKSKILRGKEETEEPTERYLYRSNGFTATLTQKFVSLSKLDGLAAF